MCDREQERDELRARFTGWLEVLAYRVRRKYLMDCSRELLSVPLDRISEEQFVTQNVQEVAVSSQALSFNFEEDQLAQAFANLPDKKKQVLTMLFVLEMKPEEIANKLGCTVHNVYNQRSLALKRLRMALKGGGEHD